MNRAFFACAALAAAPVIACSSAVTNATSGSSSSGAGGAATTATTGTGGAGNAATTGTGGAGNAATTGTGTGGGAPVVCGGKTGKPCGADAYCDFADSQICGNADGQGVCQPKPLDCAPDDCPGACGCDGNFYCNVCLANLAGTDVTGNLACMLTDTAYVAQSLVTDLPRFVILRSSVSKSQCFRLFAEPTSTPGSGISGDGWTIQQIVATNDVNDCIFAPGAPPPPVGQTVSTTLGSGTLSFATAPTGCTAGIHATASFPGAPPWVLSLEHFDADGLVIKGGCP